MPVSIGETTAEERRAVMRQAVTYNLPCDVWVETETYHIHGKSRFFSLQPGRSHARVLIEAPVSEGTLVPVRPGQTLEVYFRVDQVRYTYHATALQRTEFPLHNGSIARALSITYPERMTRGQRREYYRIQIPVQTPIELTYGILNRNAADPIHAPQVLYTGRTDILDLGGGGLAFELHEQRAMSVGPGDRLLCTFTIPTGETLEFHGRIAYQLHNRGLRTVKYGVQFIDIEKSVKFKIARDRLLRYVVNVQREHLARRSGIYD